MPNTTNFNWPTPADTDLVKDGAAAIRNLGNGIDTSLIDLKGGTTGQILSKASNADMDFTFITPNVGDITEVQAGVGISVASGTGPIPIITNSSTDLITTAGDLLYGTAADTVARLGIGTAGQVLKVNSGATAPEWGAASSGLTLIKTASYSGVANTGTTFDDVFSSTYTNYLLVCDFQAVTNTADMLFQYRYAGPTTQATAYAAYRDLIAGQTSPTSTISFQNGTTSVILNDTTGSSSYPTYGTIEVFNIGTSTRPVHTWNFYGDNNQEWASGGGGQGTARTYTGFILSATTGNISGTVSVYGLAK